MMAPAAQRRRRISYATLFPDELLTEILLRLPVELVPKCRIVCRRWRDLTSTPYFLETHYARQSIPAILLQENAGCKEDEICSGMKLSLIEECEEEATRMSPRITSVRPKCIAADSWHNYYVCFSYNGLVLFRGPFLQEEERGLPPLTDFVIYNPVNQDTVRILTPGQALGGDIYGMFLHPILKDYCVLWGLFHGRRVEFKMLNLGSQPQWKEIEAGSSVSHRPKYPPVQINDFLYWIMGPWCKKHSFVYPTCEELILAFDIRREDFSVIPHPGPTGGCSGKHHQGMDLLEIDRFLSLVQYSCPDNNPSITIINIWTLTNVAEKSWVQSHSINIELEYLGPGMLRAIAAVNGELVLQWAYERFYTCNLKEGSIRKVWRECTGCRRACAHFKSLVSLRNCKPEIMMEQPTRRTRRTRAQNVV